MKAWISWLGKKVIQKSCLVIFLWIPYGRRTRNRLPDFTGRTIVAATHNNFYCDICVVGNETNNLPRWLAKVGLFRGPFNPILRWLGALPVVRILDASSLGKQARQINDTSFKALIQALQEPGVLCIFPEGNSLERPGLNLPLKNGIAKIALAAEAMSNFELGLKILPVGIDYHHRKQVGGGVTIRYANALYLNAYADDYRQEPKRAEQRIMADLSLALSQNYPHFASDEELRLALQFEALDPKQSLFEISLCFDQLRGDSFLLDLQSSLSAIIQKGGKATLWGRPIVAQDIGSWMLWLESTRAQRLWVLLQGLLFTPLRVLERLNNGLPDWWTETLQRRLSTSTPDYMTLKVALALLFLPPIYSLQFLALSYLFPAVWDSGPYAFLLYLTLGIFAWRWRHSSQRKLRLLRLALFCRGREHLGKAVAEMQLLEKRLQLRA